MPRQADHEVEGVPSRDPEFAERPVSTRISTRLWAELEHTANLHGRSTRHEVATAIAYWLAHQNQAPVYPAGSYSDPETELLYSRSSAKSSGGPEG